MNIILSTDPFLKFIYVLYIYNINCIQWHTILGAQYILCSVQAI